MVPRGVPGRLRPGAWSRLSSVTPTARPITDDHALALAVRHRWSPIVGVVLVAIAALAYWLSARLFDAGRPDLFYVADAFLHGRVWLERPLGPYDVILLDGRVFVPFAPFPAIAFLPLVALVGPATATAWQPLINALLAATGVALVWVLMSRLGVRSVRDRFWIALLFGFSTQVWWVVTRGGVWHTGHLIAAMLTLGGLVEASGPRRPWLLGLLAGAAFLTRAPLAFAIPFFAWIVVADEGRFDPRTWRWRALVPYLAGVLPSFVFFFWYNWARFGSPLESGYALASLPAWLEAQRQVGLFSLAHLPMNFDYLFLHLPAPIPEFPFFRPDGLGLSIFLTSPGLLLALRAPWRSSRAIALGLTALVVLVPSLLYYGGGWLQYGYRYALDSIPFVIALCGLAAAHHGVGRGWRILILFGVLVGLGGVYWAYHL